MQITNSIPPEISDAYFPDNTARLRLIPGGMVNTTYYAEWRQKKIIVQQLAPIFTAAVANDYLVVAGHLAKAGWEIPQPILTIDGRPAITDSSGRVWRALSFVPSDSKDTVAPSMANGLATYGRLLGNLHASLSKLTYRPEFILPHFHDTAYYAGQLADATPALPSQSAKTMAQKLLDTYTQLPGLPDGDKQLIHGDPRTANMLFKKGKPFTFIDWDTLMVGSIWLDLGDMLRSIAEDALIAGQPFPIHELPSAIEGYRQVALPGTDAKSFSAAALLAAQHLAIELAMRFVADYKDGDEGYFAWDHAAYSSRHAYTSERAALQWSIYCGFNELMV